MRNLKLFPERYAKTTIPALPMAIDNFMQQAVTAARIEQIVTRKLLEAGWTNTVHDEWEAPAGKQAAECIAEWDSLYVAAVEELKANG